MLHGAAGMLRVCRVLPRHGADDLWRRLLLAVAMHDRSAPMLPRRSQTLRRHLLSGQRRVLRREVLQRRVHPEREDVLRGGRDGLR